MADLPAVRLYLHDLWQPFLDVLFEGPQLCPPSEFRAVDERVTAIGRDAVLETWRRLGLTVQDHGGREWGLTVEAPLR